MKCTWKSPVYVKNKAASKKYFGKFLSLLLFVFCAANSSDSSMKVELLGKENSAQNIIKPSELNYLLKAGTSNNSAPAFSIWLKLKTFVVAMSEIDISHCEFL